MICRRITLKNQLLADGLNMSTKVGYENIQLIKHFIIGFIVNTVLLSIGMHHVPLRIFQHSYGLHVSRRLMVYHHHCFLR